LHTERFVRATYGSIAACKRVGRERNGPLLKDVRIDDARESSDTATARLTLPDGGSGELQLRRVDDGWRVAGYDVALLHALGSYMTFEQVRMTASQPGLNADGARACVAQRLDDMPDDSLRSYVYTAVGARREGIDDVVTLIARCLADPRSGRGGQSYLRPYFVQDAVAAARRKGLTDAELRCFERKLGAFTDEEIAEHVARDKADPPPSTRRMAEALVACDA
jgi:hypothetical protein